MQTFAPGLKPVQTAPTSEKPLLTKHPPRQHTPSILPLTFSQIPVHSPAKRDEPESEAPAPAAPEAAAKTPETQSGNSGSDPDVITPDEGRTTAPETEADDKADKAVPVVANIRINPNPVAATSQSDNNKTDAAVAALTQGALTQPDGGTLAATEFGKEAFKPTFTGVSHAFAGGNCTITATFNPVCPWTTQSRGRTDVPSATDAVVTKDNWPDIKSDLAPKSTSPFKSPRTNFYSQKLVERHEKFHGTEDEKWVTSSGLGIVKTKIESGTVSDTPAATAAVAALLESARVLSISENLKWYKGTGTSHDSFKGEIDAYADGKAEYQKLADDVEVQGKKLATPPPPPPPPPAHP
jgi:hypothetical protein